MQIGKHRKCGRVSGVVIYTIVFQQNWCPARGVGRFNLRLRCDAIFNKEYIFICGAPLPVYRLKGFPVVRNCNIRQLQDIRSEVGFCDFRFKCEIAEVAQPLCDLPEDHGKLLARRDVRPARSFRELRRHVGAVAGLIELFSQLRIHAAGLDRVCAALRRCRVRLDRHALNGVVDVCENIPCFPGRVVDAGLHIAGSLAVRAIVDRKRLCAVYIYNGDGRHLPALRGRDRRREAVCAVCDLKIIRRVVRKRDRVGIHRARRVRAAFERDRRDTAPRRTDFAFFAARKAEGQLENLVNNAFLDSCRFACVECDRGDDHIQDGVPCAGCVVSRIARRRHAGRAAGRGGLRGGFRALCIRLCRLRRFLSGFCGSFRRCCICCSLFRSRPRARCRSRAVLAAPAGGQRITGSRSGVIRRILCPLHIRTRAIRRSSCRRRV